MTFRWECPKCGFVGWSDHIFIFGGAYEHPSCGVPMLLEEYDDDLMDAVKIAIRGGFLK